MRLTVGLQLFSLIYVDVNKVLTGGHRKQVLQVIKREDLYKTEVITLHAHSVNKGTHVHEGHMPRLLSDMSSAWPMLNSVECCQWKEWEKAALDQHSALHNLCLRVFNLAESHSPFWERHKGDLLSHTIAESFLRCFNIPLKEPDLNSEQVAQGFVQPGLKNLHRWRLSTSKPYYSPSNKPMIQFSTQLAALLPRL